jgi:glycosyltransferase involved in cell wall biosynthesis
MRACGARAWHLVVVGSGPLQAELQRQAEELGTAALVHFVGQQGYDRLPVYYGLASAFIHASTTEPWGLVVNEAMASGLPVFASHRVTSAVDLVRDNGWLFDPFHVRELALHMVKACSGQYDLSAMGDVSRERIKAWSPETFASRLWSSAGNARAAGAPPTPWVDQALPAVLARVRRSWR